jgi:2-C-methyl-D-erythritol 4-phosphate cytidylyltransferase
MREMTAEGSIPVDRNKLRIIQTPQVFRSEILLKAFQAEYRESFTDEATVAEAAGFPVHLVEGLKMNIKLTTPEDFILAEAYLNRIKKTH